MSWDAPMTTTPSVTTDPHPLPVLFDVDVAVLGGALAGIAAALACSRQGQRVVVVESRTYLGREITATLQPWIGPGPTSALWGELLERLSIQRRDGEIPLPIDALKRALEDCLLEARVELLYASRPVAVLQGEAA